jgi:predicted dehydrogenase
VAGAQAKAQLIAKYLKAAARNPRLAVKRAYQISEHAAVRAQAAVASLVSSPAPAPPLAKVGTWTQSAAARFEPRGGGFFIEAGGSAGHYQVVSAEIPLPEGKVPCLRVRGQISAGRFQIGALSEGGVRWLGSREFGPGAVDDTLVITTDTSPAFSVVIAAAEIPGSATFEAIEAQAIDRTEAQAASDIDDIGFNIGYSVAGEVVAIGSGIEDLAIGDRVAACGAGLANHAEFVNVPRNLVVLVPKGVDLVEASATTIGSIALQGVRRARPEMGERIAVIGLGLIGQITAQLLKAAGCSVVGLDLSANRVKRALDLGLTDGSAEPEAFKRLVRDITNGHGVDAVVITAASKSDAILNLAMEIARRRARVVIVGDIGLKAERVHFYRKEIDLLMSTSYGPGRYDARYEEQGIDYPLPYVRWTLNRNMAAFLDAVATGRVSVKRLTDRVVPFDQAPEVYKELAESSAEAPLGVALEYAATPTAAADKALVLGGHRKAPLDGPASYALVGAGGFGTATLVPQMDRLKDLFFLRGVVSRDAVRGGNFARSHRVEILATEIEAVLARPEISLLVVATRHHEHADQVVKCLDASRAVFVEKPLALTWEELERVEAAYARSSSKFLMVGFNRRFAPGVARLRELLKDRRSPLVINYRLHAGYIPLDHWVHGAQGGGRNIGEACHMYDLMRSLAGAAASSIDATAIRPGDQPFAKTDNFCATIGYEDGSVGNLVYTALGPKSGLRKERIEVFCDQESYLLDDFKKLTRQSTGEVLWESTEVDKGHGLELKATGENLKAGMEAPIPAAELFETSAVALTVNDLLLRDEGAGLA